MAQTPEILREVVKEKRKFLRSFNKHFSGKSSASPESLSLELDGLWDDFEAAYDRYDNCLDTLDEATAKKFNRDRFMSGKSLAGYMDEAKLEYEEAVGKIDPDKPLRPDAAYHQCQTAYQDLPLRGVSVRESTDLDTEASHLLHQAINKIAPNLHLRPYFLD